MDDGRNELVVTLAEQLEQVVPLSELRVGHVVQLVEKGEALLLADAAPEAGAALAADGLGLVVEGGVLAGTDRLRGGPRVEFATVDPLLRNPLHQYVEGLPLRAVDAPDGPLGELRAAEQDAVGAGGRDGRDLEH